MTEGKHKMLENHLDFITVCNYVTVIFTTVFGVGFNVMSMQGLLT